MSFIDRLAAAITPTASAEDRREARQAIERLGAGEPWLEMILQQHREIERLFAELRNNPMQHSSRRTLEELAELLTGHANAEEAVLYPEVAEFSGKTHAGMAYEEHAMTKIQLAKLRNLDPSSQEWREKLEHVESAVQQHVYQEEASWLPDLVNNLPPERKAVLTERYQQEFGRYMNSGRAARPGGASRPVQDADFAR